MTVACALGCGRVEAGASARRPAPLQAQSSAQLVAEVGLPSSYPPTRREVVSELLHGVEVPDPYRWLEDASSEEVQRWMAAEDDLAQRELATLSERPAIESRLREILYFDVVSPPLKRKGRYFFGRRLASQERSAVVCRDGKSGTEKVLLDPNAWSHAGDALGEWLPSPDGKKVVYQARPNNSDEATLHVIDVETGKVSSSDVIEGAKYFDLSWSPRSDGFYYSWIPPKDDVPAADRPGYTEIRYHTLGRPVAQDIAIREKTGDPTTFLFGSLSHDGRWLLATVRHGWASHDIYVRDLRGVHGSPTKGEWKPIVVGQKAHYRAIAFKDQLYVATDEGAPKWRIFRVDPTRPERARWHEVVPERSDATLSDFSIVGGRLVLHYLEDASSRLEVRDIDGGSIRKVALPGIGSISDVTGTPDEDEAYWAFQSFTTPREVYELSVGTSETKRWATTNVAVDSTAYDVEQVFFPSKDGTRLSMFLVGKKDRPRDGSGRALLYGYGGFQLSMTPKFSASVYPWLERGGLYAVVNLRGGGEYGDAWHQAGMLLKKQNVFDDFIAAAEYLVEKGYTRPSRLAISGRSNGGLLVGAAAVQRPDLFAAVICTVPLLDMVRYHRFGSGKTWVSEYGSSDDAAQFAALFGYSPYHHVRDGVRYPAMLLQSADSDDRVDPMHARKFTAAMQVASAGGPVLLRIERNAGHGGADLVRSAVEQGADAYSFAIEHTKE
ncbi:MAG: S9 family peptidase [Polyangiaceae bacterium]|nr:S9 family peptidase [Polyangiaceae bacterium]